MDKNLTEIIISKETVSDDTYKVGDLLFQNGNAVKKGQIIGSFETSKADMDIEAPENGYIFYAEIEPGSLIKVGDIFAVISPVSEYPAQYFAGLEEKRKLSATDDLPQQVTGFDGVRFSKSALEIIRKNNLNLSLFKGMKLVTKADAERLIGQSVQRPLQNTDPRPQIIIIGAGGHAKICIDIIRQNNLYRIVGATGDAVPDMNVLGVPVLGSDEEVLEKIFNEGVKHAVIGIGALKKSELRQTLFNKLKAIGFNIPTIIHPKAICEPSVVIGEGCQIMAGAIIGSNAVISNNCIVNAGAVISHDCLLEENVHITPGAILAGNVYVSQNAIIGMGATVFIGVNIGTNAIVTNNANVVKDVSGNVVVAGNPAQPV